MKIKIPEGTLYVIQEEDNFWKKAYSDWEPETLNAIKYCLNKDLDFLDIGAWSGPTSLYASFYCNKVIALEPDEIAFKHLLSNIKSSKINNIYAIKGALSTNNNEVNVCSVDKFGCSYSNTNNRGSFGNKAKAYTIFDIVSMFDLKLGLVKIDIEGSEFDILPDCLNLFGPNKVPIHISFHYPILDTFINFEHILELIFKYYDTVYCDQLFTNVNKDKMRNMINYELCSFLLK